MKDDGIRLCKLLVLYVTESVNLCEYTYQNPMYLPQDREFVVNAVNAFWRAVYEAKVLT